MFTSSSQYYIVQNPSIQYSTDQHVGGQFINDQYIRDQHVNGQFISDQYTSDQYTDGQYTSDQYVGNQYPTSQYPSNQRPSHQLPISAHCTHSNSVHPPFPHEYVEKPALPYSPAHPNYDTRYRQYPSERPYRPHQYERVDSAYPIRNDPYDSIPPNNKSVAQVAFSGFADSDYHSNSRHLNAHSFPANSSQF